MRKGSVLLFLIMALGALVAPAPAQGENKGYLEMFETVWSKVNETYFDPSFGGLDWKGVHDRYRPRIAAAKSDEEFYRLINDMLWELKVSHANVIPPGSFALYEPLVFAAGGPGLDIRVLDGAAVVTSVKPGSRAEQAGLSPGLMIQAIDGIAVGQIVRDAELRVPPPANSRSRSARITKAILSRLYGTPGKEVSILYEDKGGQKREQNIVRAKRTGVPVGPVFLAIEFEARRLDGGIGYIRLNTLQPQLAPQIARAIQTMGDVRGIVLDLRGNSGGEIEGAPGLFLNERACLYLRRSRSGETQVFFDPAANAYKGPLAVLIDRLSGSASELFAASLQAVGRAVVVGDRSPGSVMESDTKIFENGAVFMYPVAQLRMPDGTVLEGHGVVPDIEVGLDRGKLLQGVDSQLDAAVRQIEKKVP